jgi:hypothetical protein
LVSSAFIVSFLVEGFSRYFVGSIIIVITIFYSYLELNKRIGIRSMIVSIKAKILHN